MDNRSEVYSLHLLTRIYSFLGSDACIVLNHDKNLVFSLKFDDLDLKELVSFRTVNRDHFEPEIFNTLLDVVLDGARSRYRDRVWTLKLRHLIFRNLFDDFEV